MDVFKNVYFMLSACCITISPDDYLVRALPQGDQISQFLRDRVVRRNAIVHDFSLELNYILKENRVYSNIYEVPLALLIEETEFCIWVKDEIKLIESYLEKGVQSAKFYDKELVMDFVRKAIMADRWFDTSAAARKRSYVVRLYISQLWQIQMGYRLLHRRDAILIPPSHNSEDVDPMFQDLDYFLCGDSFPVLYSEEEENNVPIRYWMPDRVYNAFKILSRSRVMPVMLQRSEKIDRIHSIFKTRSLHEKGIVFVTQKQVAKFRDYIVALTDRLAMLCYYPAEIDSAKFYTEYPLWFKAEKRDIDVEQIREQMGIKDARIDTLNKTNEHHLKEAANVQKSSGFADRVIKPMTRKERIKIVEDALNEEMNTVQGLRNDISILEETLKETELSANDADLDPDIARSDARSAVYLRGLIAERKKSLQSREITESRIERNKRKKLNSNIMTLLDSVMKYSATGEGDDEFDQELKHKDVNDRAETGNLTLAPADSWYHMNMCISDYVRGWYVKTGEGVSPTGYEFLKKRFVSECIDIVKQMDDSKILEARRWIISHGLTIWERETFRMNLHGETNIDLYNVWQSIYRTAILPDPGDDWDEEEMLRATDDLPGMPKQFVELLNKKCKYHLLGRAYVGWYYLYQAYNTLMIDRWFFNWDFETDIGAANHKDVKSPVMTKIGCEWAVVLPGSWKVGVPEIMFCGYEFFDCIAVWITEVAKNNWNVHLRDEDKIVSIKGTDLYNFYTTTMESQAAMEQELLLEK